MILTPMHFTMITEFHGTGIPVKFSSKLVVDDLTVRFLLRFSPMLEKCGGVYNSYLMDYGFSQPRSSKHELLY